MKIIFILILSMIVIGCHRQEVNVEQVKKIIVDTSSAEHALDISELLDLDQVEIIKLETGDDCLTTLSGAIKIINDHIIIGDETTNRLLLFSRKGNFVRNIGNRGRGPGEYVELGGFTIIKDSVYVQDARQNKIIVYPLEGSGFREIVLDPPIYYVDLFSNHDHLYFVTNYAPTEEHYANLVAMDIRNGKREYHIPYDPSVDELELAWGLNGYTASNGSETLVIYGRNDTIYRVSDDGIHRQYVMDFTRNKIPASLLNENGMRVLGESLKNGYNSGLDEIHNLSDFFFAEFSEGSEKRLKLIYDKRQDNVLLGELLVIDDMGELQILGFWTTENNKLVLAYDVYVLQSLWEHVLSKNEFTNPELKESIKNVVLSSKEDDNPIIMIIKVKK